MTTYCANCGARLKPETELCPHCNNASSLPKVVLDGQPTDGKQSRNVIYAQKSKTDGVIGPKPTTLLPETPELEVEGSETAANLEDVRLGQTLQSRYRLDRVLGRGGFGAVYLAEDVKLKRVCVVKRMLIPAEVTLDELQAYRTNFDREAGLLVQLNHPGHPSIPEIYDYFSEPTGNYLVMKYIEGQSLEAILEQNAGKIPWQEAVRYIVDVCDGLHYMHSQSQRPVMHRDIKPANILLGDDGRVWLVDFGLAKANPVDSVGGSKLTQAIGTFGYTPLEQWLGQPVPASDLYAVGATLHQLVTGLHPGESFEEDSGLEEIQARHGRFKSVRKVDRNLPKPLDAIITEATLTDPEKRPTTLQLKQKLEALVSGTSTSALYTFKSGESAQSSYELAELCTKNRQEAQGYLYNGDFERWFRMINRNDLAEAAVQAVKHGKDQPDGLRRFLKQIAPNLFLKRLNKAAWQLGRLTVQFVLIGLIVILLAVIGGSYGARWLIRQGVGNYAWNYESIATDQINRFEEAEINESADMLTASFLDEVRIDVGPPDRVDLKANWGDLQIEVPLTVRLAEGQPRFHFDQVNGIPLFLIAENLSKGINEGIDRAFAEGPIDVTELEIREQVILFRVKPSGRAP